MPEHIHRVSNDFYYTVKSGDSFWAIANKHGISMQSLLDANHMTTKTVIHPGDVLVIPSKSGSSSSGSKTKYTVKSGDSFWAIANKFGIPMQSLLDANHMTTKTIIHPGDVLIIPSKSGSSSSGGSSSGGSSGSSSGGSTPSKPTSVGGISTKFAGSKLSRSSYVSKVKSYCSKNPSSLASEICNNAGTVYDTAKSVDCNPELVVVRAIVEGNSPGISKHNYWGMGCVNTGGYAACISYSSLAAGVKGFGNNVKQYPNLTRMMAKYAYIGKYWYNPGSWSVGGCKYFPYIKQYMSAGRRNKVTSVCNGAKCSTSGGSCTKTIQEDQDAYATWQVVDKMGPLFKSVFGTTY